MLKQQTNTERKDDLLDGWLSRTEVAAGIGVTSGTLSRWETRRIGPPCARIGRKVLYRADAVRDWLKGREGAGAATSTTIRRRK